MRSKMKKLTCLILCILIVTLMAACQTSAPQATSAAPKQTDTPQKETATKTAETATPEASEPEAVASLESYTDVMPLSGLITSYMGGPSKGTDTMFYKLMLKRFNIDLAGVEWDVNDGLSKVSMYAASGNMPDFIVLGTQDANARSVAAEMAEAGMLLEIEPLIRQYAPNLMHYQSEEVMNIMRDADGKLYRLPNFSIKPELQNELTVEVLTVLMARDDMMKKVGIEDPKTTEDFYKLLKGMKELPAVDGKAIIPFSSVAGLFPINAMFGLLKYRMVPNDQEKRMVSQYETPEYLSFLKYASKLYREGLIHNEIYTTTWEKPYYELAPGGYAGVVTMWSPDVENISNQVKQKFGEQASFRVIPLPKAPGVDKTEMGYNFTLGSTFTVFSAKTSDPVRLAKYLDWLCTKEGIATMGFGPPSKEEGVWYIDESTGKFVQNKKVELAKNAETPGYNSNVLGSWSYGLTGVIKFTPDLLYDEDVVPQIGRVDAKKLYADDIYINPTYDRYTMMPAGEISKAKSAVWDMQNPSVPIPGRTASSTV